MNHLHFTPRVGNTVLNHPWRQFHYRLPTKLLEFAVKDPGFLLGGGGGQHTILSKFPENCMKLKEFWYPGGGGGRDACLLRSVNGKVMLSHLFTGIHVTITHYALDFPVTTPSCTWNLGIYPPSFDLGTSPPPPHTHTHPAMLDLGKEHLVLTVDGHHWRHVHSCSLEYLPPTPPPTSTDTSWWPQKYVRLTDLFWLHGAFF